MPRELDHHRPVDCDEGLHVSLRQFCISKLAHGPDPAEGRDGAGQSYRRTADPHSLLEWSCCLSRGPVLSVASVLRPIPPPRITQRGKGQRGKGQFIFVVEVLTNPLLFWLELAPNSCKGSLKFTKYIPHLKLFHQYVNELFLSNIFVNLSFNYGLENKNKYIKQLDLEG